MAMQPVYRTGTRSAATARRLLAGTQMAAHIRAQTFQEEQDVDIMRCVAEHDILKGQVLVKSGQPYFKVQSTKFAGYYYVVAWNEKHACYQCSCDRGCAPHGHSAQVQRHEQSES